MKKFCEIHLNFLTFSPRFGFLPFKNLNFTGPLTLNFKGSFTRPIWTAFFRLLTRLEASENASVSYFALCCVFFSDAQTFYLNSSALATTPPLPASKINLVKED
jgi:hypothetical protein